ncbi:MAG: VacJ family lipoprotein [Desulfobulbaceae bacterium]|jgi:phospholipid-binding lipoprotein MlaA|nr:VacJ family lipoprotein [Desulfobulbaceae bacterium]
MRTRVFLLFCLLLSPAIARAADIEFNVGSMQDNISGGAVVPHDVLGGGNTVSGDPLDDDFSGNINTIADPLEGWNRLMFRFNDEMYIWVLQPTTNFYKAALPADIRGCVDNFFVNISAPLRMANSFLQGRFRDAGAELSRFVINSTLGVAGLADVAAIEFGINRRRADFGQTLGRYGVGGGMFICWPLLGPSTLRDSVGTVVDTLATPTTYINKNVTETITINAVQMVNKMSVSPDIYDQLKKTSLDPYVAMRQGYIDFRRATIDAAKRTPTEKKP